MKQLAGWQRNSYAPPNGYPMDGAAYLSSSYVDDVSRVGLIVATVLTNLDTHRTDVTATATRTELATRLASNVVTATDWFIETKLGMGNVISGNASSPYAWPASHVSIVRAVMASSPLWAYWDTSPTSKQASQTLVGLGLGNVHAMWR
jgi:hypothetical protein